MDRVPSTLTAAFSICMVSPLVLNTQWNLRPELGLLTTCIIIVKLRSRYKYFRKFSGKIQKSWYEGGCQLNLEGGFKKHFNVDFKGDFSSPNSKLKSQTTIHLSLTLMPVKLVIQILMFTSQLILTVS